MLWYVFGNPILWWYQYHYLLQDILLNIDIFQSTIQNFQWLYGICAGLWELKKARNNKLGGKADLAIYFYYVTCNKSNPDD